MTAELVTLLGRDRHPIATAKVSEEDGHFIGDIDLTAMPAKLRQQFEEYEEIVQKQMFSFLDDVEEQIQMLRLKVVFANGGEADLADLQIYPTTQRVSFSVAQVTVPRPSPW